MELTTGRRERIAAIDHVIRKITWQGQKQSLQTLSRPDIALTMPQMVTLFAIRSVGTCRMSELAELTNQSAGTLTGIVDRLIEDGLVRRVRDTDDRRVVQVALTDAGEERLARVEHARVNDMLFMLSRFSSEQLVQFEELLNLLLQGIYEWHATNVPHAALSNGNGNGNGVQPTMHNELGAEHFAHHLNGKHRVSNGTANHMDDNGNGSNGNGNRHSRASVARRSSANGK